LQLHKLKGFFFV